GRSSARSPHGPVVSLAPQLLFDNGLFWDCPQRLANLFLQFTKKKKADFAFFLHFTAVLSLFFR
ncbi:hypothetical protein, partial [Lacticaseibacillus casei]|uniref:hypothetical protein n=1 Tax=Lacticaseibacillus casei TaxID=1582 RepID=UPI001EDFA987